MKFFLFFVSIFFCACVKTQYHYVIWSDTGQKKSEEKLTIMGDVNPDGVAQPTKDVPPATIPTLPLLESAVVQAKPSAQFNMASGANMSFEKLDHTTPTHATAYREGALLNKVVAIYGLDAMRDVLNTRQLTEQKEAVEITTRKSFEVAP